MPQFDWSREHQDSVMLHHCFSTFIGNTYHINFKILLLTFKCFYGLAPNYLIDLISIKKQSRYSLRSNESLLLQLPGIKTHPILGDRAFQSAAPYLWNALP